MEAKELRIKSSELRIGNYYHLIDVEADPTDAYCISDGYSLHLIDEYNNAAPIPLTEEWLVKFGFVFINGYGYKHGRIRGWFKGRNPFIWKYNDIDIVIKHVHQLQNLYFALTGQELTVK